MASFNRVTLLGNLTRDPELKYTPQGGAVCNFALAVNRQFKGADGEVKKEVSFFNIVVWNKIGENCAKYLKKGSSALVEGRLATRSYDNKEKQKVYVTEIVAENVQFISTPGERSERKTAEDPGPNQDDGQGYAAPAAGSDVPF